jgi:hypothetical protein
MLGALKKAHKHVGLDRRLASTPLKIGNPTGGYESRGDLMSQMNDLHRNDAGWRQVSYSD